ncbi:hypothetical protein [uncultured Polaribacter sp.]|uniref:hypothetical protein n=1 Tax=uncultured Polaribacter sp. TaxID=174711 RepID=UPI00262A9079|nr:hypothetical protein [uncultured Polaribacter sp.]
MKYLSILVIIAFLGCKANKQVKENTTTQDSDWSITSEKSYLNTDKVNIQLVNNTKTNLVIFDPFLKKIEKFDGEQWVKTGVAYCPCGSCPPPPETMSILPNNSHSFTWNKNIISCTSGKQISTPMESGRYRVTFNYGASENVRTFEKLVVEFEI